MSTLAAIRQGGGSEHLIWGGSNSNRLREIGVEAGVPSSLLADRGGLRAERVRGVDVVGLTAGASAPEALVQEVIAALREIEAVDVTQMRGVEETIVFRLPPELRRTDDIDLADA